MAEAVASTQVAQKWPSWAWALSIPEVGAILSDPSITDQSQLESRIQATNWYKQTQPAVRSWQARVQTDPAGAAQDKQQKEADVNDLYKSMGLQPSVEDQQAIAQQALQFGWTTKQLQDAVIGHIGATGLDKNTQGAIQTAMTTLKQSASNYYVGLDDGTAQQWATQIAAGEKTLDDFAPTLQSWAKNKFAAAPDVLSAIDRGETVDAYFSPYKTHIAQLMNTSADSVDLQKNPLYSKVINYTDPKTGQGRPMTYGEMDNYLRSTDEYDRTPDAMNQAASVGAGILKTFGKVA